MQHNPSASRKKTGLLHLLKTLKDQQDQLKGMKTDIYSSLLAKVFKGDTIPIMLKVNDDYLETEGFEDQQTGSQPFLTKYYCIESIDEQSCMIKLSLLRPLDIFNCAADCFKDLYRLEKTTSTIKIKIGCLTAVQCLDIDLMNRQVIIEPKW